jgi:hypothetical protein
MLFASASRNDDSMARRNKKPSPQKEGEGIVFVESTKIPAIADRHRLGQTRPFSDPMAPQIRIANRGGEPVRRRTKPQRNCTAVELVPRKKLFYLGVSKTTLFVMPPYTLSFKKTRYENKNMKRFL